jgi:2-hydroxychromene-2-carboxylate isomerase
VDVEERPAQGDAAGRPVSPAGVPPVQPAARPARVVAAAPRSEPCAPDRRAVFRRLGAALHVSDPHVVKQVADEVGLDGATLVAQAEVPEAKAL